MKVFISWSGDRSKEIAECLPDWLPTVVQSIEPFVSSQDIPVGGRGMNVLASELEECSFGVLCLTRENMDRPWLNFEAGALSKTFASSSVVPLLIDLNPSDLTGPIVQLQAISATDRDGMFEMMKQLADLSSPSLTERRLRTTFESFWPRLEAKIVKLQQPLGGATNRREIRNDRDLLEEILTLSRLTEHELAQMAANGIMEGILSSGSGVEAERKGPTWRKMLSQRMYNDMMAQLRDLQLPTTLLPHAWELDDSKFRIILNYEEPITDNLRGSMRQVFRNVSSSFGVPIHVQGPPIGNESFSPRKVQR